jgi:hypothetical protein
MSVISVTRSWKGREQRRANGETTRIDVYTALTEAVASESEDIDIRDQIEQDADTPQYGAQAPDRADLFVRDVSVREGGGPALFEVIVSYSTRKNADALDPETPVDQPELDPPSVSFGTSAVSEVLDIDADGNPVINSAREPFDPPLQRERSEAVIVFARNFTECTITPAWIRSFTDVVNNANITGFGDRGELRIVGAPSPTWVPLNGSTPGHWRVSFNLLWRENPSTAASDSDPATPPFYSAHFRKVLDQGYREYLGPDTGDDDKPLFAVIRGEDMSPANQPVGLDGNGRKLSVGADPVFLYFREVPEADFSSLGIEWPYCTGASSSAT